MTFAEEMKQANQRAIWRKANPDIEAWKKRQKEYIISQFLEDALKHFKWAADCGELAGRPYKNRRGGDPHTQDIPDAEKLTKQMVEDVFKPYGITVVSVELDRGSMISIELKIE